MNFYPLGPTTLMNRLCGPTYPYHMVLAQHLYDKDMMPTDYFMWYKRRCSLRGYHVILDNGVYEGEKVSMDYLIRCVVELNPHVVILPDVPHDMTATLAGGEVFKVMLKRHGWRGHTMTVVHAEPGNFEQFCHSYMEACKQSPVVGISRLTEDFGAGKELTRRAQFLSALRGAKLYDQTKWHHALGMGDGSLEELKSLKESKLFRSCDSSAPIWRGLMGTYLGEEWIDQPFDPTFCKDGDVQRAYKNLDQVLSICTYGQEASNGS